LLNGTLQLLEWAVEDGLEGQVVLGMDAARRGYYRVNGGSPGLSWLLAGFTDAMAGRGFDAAKRHRWFVDNPARAFAFAEATEEGDR
jgi:predicted metal-dependent phosphotriesterase family hydrolase